MKASLTTCDTSVLVPAFRTELPQHEVCRAQLSRLDALAAHTLLETYRVLTSMPALPALSPEAVAQALEALSLPHVQLPPAEYMPLLKRFAGTGRPGGAIYDAQIAATAKHHGLTLLSRDRRAAVVYEVVGVDYELI